MSKKLSQGGKPATPYPKRFYVPPDIVALRNHGKIIVQAMRRQYVKRMTVDVYKIRSGKKQDHN